MAPIVVGIQNIPISTTLPTDGETLVYNAAQDKYIPGASAGISSVSSSGNITGSGTSLDPIILKDNISLNSVTASFSGTFVGDGSGLTGIQQDLTPYATTGSNTFTAKQTLRASTTASAPLNIPTGSNPTSPVNGDIWTTSISLLTRINGTTSTIITTNPSFSTTLQPVGFNSGSGFSYSIIGGTANTSGSYTAGGITLAGGAANSLQGTGGSVTIRGGTGGTASGSVNIGTTNTNAVNIGASGRTTAVNGNLTVAGNMTVNGTTTSVNSTNLEITDKYILIASGATDATVLNGAGIQFGSVPSEDARIIYDAVNDEMEIYPAARSAEFRGSFVGDGANITGTPYDIAGEVTGSITSGSELLNYLSPRAFTMQAFSQYTGSGAASAYVMKNSVSSSFPTSVSANDLVTVISTTTGSKAYFTIKGVL
jgi:hypothetical protein